MSKQPYQNKQAPAAVAPETTTETAVQQPAVEQTTPVEPAAETNQAPESNESNQGEITPTQPEQTPTETPAATETPVAAPVVEPAPEAPVAPVVSTAVEKLVGEPTEVSVLKQTLATYVAEMAANRRISTEEGAGNQLRLFNALVSTVTHPDSKTFIALMGIWLETIRAHRSGVFHEARVYRFSESVALTKPKRQQFEYLIHLFLTVADGISVQQSIDTEVALRAFDSEYASRLAAFAKRVTGSN